jgi:hypothetical protein
MDATDAASRVLSRGLHPDKLQTYAALSEDGDVPRTTLWYRAHGRPSKEEKAASQQYLTPPEEKALVKQLIRSDKNGFPVMVKYLPSLAFVIACQRTSVFQIPASDVTIKPPGKNWAQAFYKRHPEVHPRRLKALAWRRHDKSIFEKMTHWFEVIGKELHDPVIVPENVYNMDETGVMLSKLTSVKVLVGKDDMRGYRGAGVNRKQVTAIECISADGRFLHPMIIWPATTHRSNWTTYPTPGWHYACSKSGYTDSIISFEWLKRVFDPQTKARAQQKPRILIGDGLTTHETLEIFQYCFENNIILCRIPSHTSHKLQPCDVGVFSPLKTAYREQVERLYRGGAQTVGKEHFTSLYSRAREVALTARNIKAGWVKSGLYPFNPDRVLRDTPKPSDEPPILKREVQVVSRLKDGVPHTPVTSEALTSLRSVIEQDIDVLDEPSKCRVQKLANAAQNWVAECALLLDENRLLFDQNNESNIRKSTKSTVVGKAKVMSYEDLGKAKAARAAKEEAKATAGKGKRGRKRKSPASETDTPESGKSASKEQAIAGKGKRGRKRKSPPEAGASEPKAKVARMSEASEPGKAPVVWVNEVQEQAKALMAWMERNAKASEGLTGADERSAGCGR